MIQKPVYKVYKDSILTEKINQPVKKQQQPKNKTPACLMEVK